MENVKTNTPNKCAICYKCYSLQRNLYRHLREAHLVFPAPQANKGFKCQERDCQFSALRLGVLRSHLHKTHHMKFEKVELTFDNNTEFERWKDQEEGETKANFVRERGKQTLKNGDIKECLPCHRSGHFLPKGNGKRVLKRQGTRKLGTRCTAEMEVVTYKNGKVCVVYHKTHYGHAADVEHVILSRSMRTEITEKLVDADSIDTVLHEVHGHGTHLNHIKLKTLQRKDLRNLLRWQSVQKSKLLPTSHKHDQHLWSEERVERTVSQLFRTTEKRNTNYHCSKSKKLDGKSCQPLKNSVSAAHWSTLKIPEGPPHKFYFLKHGVKGQHLKNSAIVNDKKMQYAFPERKEGISSNEELYPSGSNSKDACSGWRDIFVPVLDSVALENTLCRELVQCSGHQIENYSEIVVVQSSNKIV